MCIRDRSLAGGELTASSALSLSKLRRISEAGQKLLTSTNTLSGDELSTAGALALAHLRRITESSQKLLLAAAKALARGKGLSAKFLTLVHLGRVVKASDELLLLGANTFARDELSACKNGSRKIRLVVSEEVAENTCSTICTIRFARGITPIASNTYETKYFRSRPLLTTGGLALAHLGLYVK